MEKNFEQAITELEEIVKLLEKGDLSLEESMEKFKLGVELSNICNKKLEGAEKSIVKLIEESNGNVIEEKLNI